MKRIGGIDRLWILPVRVIDPLPVTRSLPPFPSRTVISLRPKSTTFTLLPVEYFHVVFTIPERIASIGLQNKRTVYNILFRAASETLLTIAADPKHLGAKIGLVVVLHTWGQNLMHHPHLDCLVTGGGLSPDHRRWISCRPGFFLPIRVLSRMFRGKFLAYLKEAFHKGKLQFHGKLAPLADPQAFSAFLQTTRKTDWVVYSKPPFGGPAQMLDYLGRYTHRLAICNHRLVQLNDGPPHSSSSLTRSSQTGTHPVIQSHTEAVVQRFLSGISCSTEPLTRQ